MKLRRLVIRDFQKLRGETVIDAIGDGITIVAGDNEAGKSTVLRALQCALFERHKVAGEVLKGIQPYGGAVEPQVELEFDLGGRACRLEKSFGRTASAMLQVGTARFTGEAADEELEKRLRFDQRKGRADPGPAYRGLHGLFWVEQGTAFQALHVNEQARQSIEETLQAQVGAVLGGRRGVRLLEAARARRDLHFTAGGKERGTAKEMAEQLATSESALAQTRADLVALDDATDRLRRVEGRIRERERRGEAEQWREAVKQAQAEQSRLAALKRSRDKAEADQKLAAREAELAQRRWQERSAAREALTRVQHEFADLAAAAAESETAYARADLAQAEAAAREAAAEAAFTEAESRLRAARRRTELAAAATSLAEAEDRLVRAEAAAAALAKAEAEAALLRLDEASIRRIDRARQKAHDAGIALASAAAALVFRPAEGRTARRAGSPVPAGAPLTVTETTIFDLDGFGALEVRPGGGTEMETLRSERDKAARALAKALADCGMADIGAFEAAVPHWRNLGTQAANSRNRLEAIAPGGLDALRYEAARERARLEALAVDAPADEPPADPAAAADEAETLHSALREAQAEAKATTATANKAKTEAVAAQRLKSTKADESNRLRQTLDAARAATSDEALATALAEARTAADEAKSLFDAADEAYRRADPDAANVAFEMANKALSRHNEELRKDEDERLSLRARLSEKGAQGLGEKTQQLAGEVERLGTTLAAVRREAAAARLLCETLEEAQRAAREAFTAPVRARMGPYLRLLFPDTDIDIDEGSFAIRHFRRGGHDEPFDALSLGTREQIAVLVRLAFAEHLAGSGEPPVVILDDALVNADGERMRRMLLALATAARRVQILVLTCRERDYAGLGAPVIRLD